MNPSRRAAAHIDAYLIAVLAVPIVLFLSNQEWLFGRGFPTDAWYNLSYYLDYGIRDPNLYWSYKAVRISWILKGLLVYKIFPALAAHYVLHLTMFFAMIVVFYLIARRLFGRLPAFLSTMALATYSQFHSVRAFEWDYNTHDSTLNTLLGLLWLLAAARGVRPRLALFGAGAAVASAIQNPYVASYVPALAFWYWSLRRHSLRAGPAGGVDLRQSLAYFVGGAAVVTAAYCLISYAVGGPFFYYWPQVREFLLFYTNGQYRYQAGYWIPIPVALRTVQGVQLPVAVTLITVGMLIYAWPRARRMEHAANALTCGMTFLLCMAAAVAWHLVGFPYLYLEHLLATLIPFEFLAIAGLFAALPATRPDRGAPEGVLVCTVFAALMAPLIFGQQAVPAVTGLEHVWSRLLAPVFPGFAEAIDYSHGYQHYYLPGRILAAFLAVAIPTALLGILGGRFRPYVPAAVVVVFLAITNVATASIPLPLYAADFSCGYYRDQFLAVVDSYRAIRPFDPDLTRTSLGQWYRADDPVQYPAESCRRRATPPIPLHETYGAIDGARYYASLPGHPPFGPVRDFSVVPRANEWWRTDDHAPVRVAVLSSDPADAAVAIGALKNLGAAVRELAATRIHEGVISFYLVILEFTR